MKKRLGCLILIISVFFTMLSVNVFAQDVTSGKCGNYCYWNFDNSTGTLTLSGTGQVLSRPWYTYNGSVKKVIIEDGITMIPSSAFENCTLLEKIDIPSSVDFIGSYCFYNCTSLQSIVIPDGVTILYSTVFGNCTSLKAVSIPESVTEIWQNAFNGCSSLSEIALPSNLQMLYSGAFNNTALAEDEQNYIDGVLYIGKYLIKASTDISGNYEIKNGTKIIASGAFENCSKLTGVTIPEGVTTVYSAFKNCKGLKTASLPSTVNDISYTFYDCDSFETFVVPESITVMDHAFENCNSLKKVTINKNLTDFRDAFSGCSSLTEVVIPEGLTEIDSWAFEKCTSLKTVALPASVTVILNGAFEGCTSLKEVTLPPSSALRAYAASAFSNCTALEKIPFPDTLENIESDVFNNCTSLEKVTFPDSLKHIGSKAFNNCTLLENIHIPKSVIKVNYSSFDNTKFYNTDSNWQESGLSVDNVLIVGKNTKVTRGIRLIADYAFEEVTRYKKIFIPQSVQYIGKGAYNDCKNLEEVWYEGTEQQAAEIHMEGNDILSNATWHYGACDIGYYHSYENSCDSTCDNCGYVREVSHIHQPTFDDNNHFEKCVICGDTIEVKPHSFANACDNQCDCGFTRTVEPHKYDNACDKDCNVCKAIRTVPAHVYDNACDKDCNVCKATRTVEPHKYDNAFDAFCNICKSERTPPNTATRSFADVASNAWYKYYVDYAVAYGLFSGTSDTTFSPNADMTRAQFVQVLANLSGAKLDNSKSSGFSDAPAGKWFTGAVKWAVDNGIASGIGGGKFNPTGKIDRQQMCMMLVNYVENYKKTSLKEKVAYKTFTDDKEIAGWAKTAVIKCFKAGLVSGTGNNKFSPKVVANRATGATIFTNFHKEYIA